MANVLIERETIGKDELEALLNGTWDEYLADHKDDDPGDAAPQVAEEPVVDETPDEPETSPEPPMAPGTPPAYNA